MSKKNIALSFIVILFFSGISAYAVDNQDGETYIITIQNGKFSTTNLEVGIGDTVEWINVAPCPR